MSLLCTSPYLVGARFYTYIWTLYDVMVELHNRLL